MQGSHTHIPETNHIPRGYIVAAILSLLFMVPLCLVPALALLFFYVSTFRSLLLLLSSLSLSSSSSSSLRFSCFCSALYLSMNCVHLNLPDLGKVKVKVTLEQATKAQKGSSGIALLFL